MSEKASTKATASNTNPGKRRGLKAVVREQGRSYVWLALKTGYTTEHISRVANGHHPGTEKFHLAMTRVLGEEYAR